MGDKMPLMTQTTQSCSMASLSDPCKNLTKNKPESENNMDLLLSIFDELNKLYEMINRLDYLIERKNIDQVLYPQEKGEKK
jgi:hypothetical protein